MKKYLLFVMCMFLGVTVFAQKSKKTPTKKPMTNRTISQNASSNDLDGYESAYVTTGDMNCINIIPKYDYSIDTELRIKNIGNTDLVTKLMNKNEDVAYRIVYIRQGETVSIKNIPQGYYYLKHGAGTKWVQKVEKEKCVGRFVNEHGYYLDEETIDFNLTQETRGNEAITHIPGYELQAGIKTTYVPAGTKSKYDSVEDASKVSRDKFNE